MVETFPYLLKRIEGGISDKIKKEKLEHVYRFLEENKKILRKHSTNL